MKLWFDEKKLIDILKQIQDIADRALWFDEKKLIDILHLTKRWTSILLWFDEKKLIDILCESGIHNPGIWYT